MHLRPVRAETELPEKAEATPFVDQLVEHVKNLPKMAVVVKALLTTIGTFLRPEQLPLITDILSLLPG